MGGGLVLARFAIRGRGGLAVGGREVGIAHLALVAHQALGDGVDLCVYR